jgi:thiamine kinase-like enzyme
MSDPFTDLANFSHDGNYTPDKTIELLSLYLGREPKKEEKYKMLLISSLVSIMWYSWAVFKMTVEV